VSGPLRGQESLGQSGLAGRLDQLFVLLVGLCVDDAE
jgi:hypothetical protein